ncbi:GDSL-type esterase/lipase family protein [Streptomyces litchfieldiae]|uniref:GDSL-type esterase/lipase family protein n=1 Tax=Streptomyces litchfieldiae TaxID=3075543 RepID=A0ABU2MZ76_9ACTN|nr:GDSL-type esterase/lipase family protein [Streptomyces sp. DSM 44938]MDT0346118.1 GDSL-type esterase/lipase family protein [Streptomyces sp. DSM 44938]
MRTTRLPRAILAVLALIAALLALQPASSAAAAEPVRIMPLGDSITGSPGCWRATLWNDLQAAGYTDLDFVGTLGPQGCGVAHDGDNEGHGGILATNMAAQNQLPAWLSATSPDVVLMHLGTNDVWSNRSPVAILSAFTTLVNQMRANNPNMTVLVAQIIPMNPSSCAECAQRTVNFNAAIPAWAAGISTSASPVRVVDHWTGFNTATDTYDGVHPNAAGDGKMADRWFDALTGVLTPSDPGEDPGEEPGEGSLCTAAATTAGSWNGGWQGEVTVTNTGDAALTGWSVHVALPTGARISQVWGGTLNASTGTVTNASWNGSLAPGATASFGYIAAAPAGTAAAATVSCTAAA